MAKPGLVDSVLSAAATHSPSTDYLWAMSGKLQFKKKLWDHSIHGQRNVWLSPPFCRQEIWVQRCWESVLRIPRPHSFIWSGSPHSPPQEPLHYEAQSDVLPPFSFSYSESKIPLCLRKQLQWSFFCCPSPHPSHHLQTTSFWVSH